MDARPPLRQAPSKRAFMFGGLGLGAAGLADSVWRQSSLTHAFRGEWATARAKSQALAQIPLFDARLGGPVAHAQARSTQMQHLLLDCIGPLTPEASLALRGLDELAADWLTRCHSPYVAELRSIAALSNDPGVFLLNCAYESSCTTLASPAARNDSAVLLHTLDWAFHSLGRSVELVRQQGPAGEFFNVTWPGAVGVLTAMAPGRFAAAINQAPLHRRFAAPSLIALDASLNVVDAFSGSDPPVMHVLRRIFEQAKDYDEAKRSLEQAPIASPTIFSLVGVEAAQTCVIERTPTAFAAKTGVATAANEWRYGAFPGDWIARGPRRRSERIEAYAGQEPEDFAWVKPPILNGATRLAIEANPRFGHIRLRGYEATVDGRSAEPVTEVLDYRV